MNTDSIARLKHQLIAAHGERMPTSVVDDFLAAHASDMLEARRAARAGPIDWPTLVRYSTFCRFDERHANYESILKAFDPALRLPDSSNCAFLGDGFGGGSLNAYRRVDIDGVPCFEKVYLKDSPDYRNSLRFYRDVQTPLAHAGLKSPAFLRAVEGDTLSVVYSALVRSAAPTTKAKAISRYRKHFDRLMRVEIPSTPAWNTAFTDHALYQDGVEKAAAFISASLGEDPAILSTLETSMGEAIMVFSHGDWYRKNINTRGVVFDWDRCGMYPAGFDLAYCFSKSLKVESIVDLDRAIKRHAPRFVRTACMPALIFFSLIFYARRVGVQAPDSFLRELYLRARDFAGRRTAGPSPRPRA